MNLQTSNNTENVEQPLHPFSGNNWIFGGLIYGSILFILNHVGPILFYQEAFVWRNIIIGIIASIIGGLAFGYIMKMIYDYQEKKHAKKKL